MVFRTFSSVFIIKNTRTNLYKFLQKMFGLSATGSEVGGFIVPYFGAKIDLGYTGRQPCIVWIGKAIDFSIFSTDFKFLC